MDGKPWFFVGLWGRQFGFAGLTEGPRAKTGLLSSEKLRLLIVGQPFNELTEILCSLIERPYLFDKPFNKPTKSYVLKVVHGESDLYKIFTQSGDAFCVVKDIFEENFTKNTDDNNILIGEVHIQAPLLKIMDITVICSANNFTDFDWIVKFSQADFLVMILYADQLLSTTEKFFLKELVAKEFGFDRCAFLVNYMDRIDQNDKNEIFEYLKQYWKPWFFRLTAAEV